MRLLRHHLRRFYLCLVVLLIPVIAGSATAYADSGTATVAVNGGSLTESNATNQISLKLSKKIHLANYALPITMIDARGSGGGWNLMITSTTFRYVNRDTDKDRLSTTASHVVGVSASCGAHSTCTVPANSISYSLVIPAASTPPPPVKFFNAARYTGLAKFILMMMVNVQVPKNVETGIYACTIVISVANGP